MTKDYKDKLLTIPNVLSIVRIFLLIPFIMLYRADKYGASIGLLFLSGATDMIDGFIARRFNMISTVGKILDPLADKITQVTVAICLALKTPAIMPVLIVFCVKEFLMMIGSALLIKKGARPAEAKWWGKVGTVVIYGFLFMVLFSNIFPSFIPECVFSAMSYITIGSILYSLFSYSNIFFDVWNGRYDFNAEHQNKVEGE